MPSITTWTRLEPRTRNQDVELGLQARVHDPLWLLGRQFQLGELNGEYAGSPVIARLDLECAQLSRYHPGALPPGVASPAAESYNPLAVPLEALVEREHVERGTGATPRQAADSGLHFLRLLSRHGMARYRQAFIAAYPFPAPTEGQRQTLDNASLRYLGIMAGRVPDGARLYDALAAALGASPSGLPPVPAIAAGDRPMVTAAAAAWLTWCGALFSDRPTGSGAWDADRMEYQFAVSARKGDGSELTLAADEYADGRLDWYAFDARPDVSLGAGGAVERTTLATIPTGVTYRGMPAARFWEFEDRRVNLAAVSSGPEDLARLALLEFALVYGNDWFLVPVPLKVGSLCRITSLRVTDTFGQVTTIGHYREVDPPSGPWRMFELSEVGTAGAPVGRGIFFLAPAVASSLESQPIEEVLLLRDEMANLAWGIERVVEGAAGQRLNRFEAYHEQQQRQPADQPAAAAPGGPTIAYRLATTVPEYWIPLLPVLAPTATNPAAIRLRRGQMLDATGTPRPIVPRGRVLQQDLRLYDEEVPRAGARVTRAYSYARWSDGSPQLWIGRRKQPGRGEGSSGLRFDLIELLSPSVPTGQE